MKGTPDAPLCGFSNAVVQILNFHGVNFEGHDVLSNEDLRSGMHKAIFLSNLHFLFRHVSTFIYIVTTLHIDQTLSVL